MKSYNYIFAGAGLSSLMLVYKMILSGKYAHKTILLIDPDLKKTNDRTWCFWEKPGHDWGNVVSKKWKNAKFANHEFSKNMDLTPYEYNMIRGIDFYKLVFELIDKQANIHFLQTRVVDFQDHGNNVSIICESETFSCEQFFNSVYDKNLVENQTKFPILQQHFVGWFLRSAQAVFDESTANFMDFSVAQKGNTRFMYVLPTSPTEALLEPTLFSHKLLQRAEYEAEIERYAQELGIKSFEIVEKEHGSIPMTCYPFWNQNTQNVLHIGTAGGWTKASTGFTFFHSDKKTSELLTWLQSETDFRKLRHKNKFWFYDLIFLEVLDRHNELGSEVFSSLFKSRNHELVFKFLNHETSFIEDLQVMLRCPLVPFIGGFFRVFKKMMFS